MKGLTVACRRHSKRANACRKKTDPQTSPTRADHRFTPVPFRSGRAGAAAARIGARRPGSGILAAGALLLALGLAGTLWFVVTAQPGVDPPGSRPGRSLALRRVDDHPHRRALPPATGNLHPQGRPRLPRRSRPALRGRRG
ncbi:MAG: hypothetical protein MZV70_49050 [Desulfobacterales bacterium]|nr:hypothetical protein [Desulfobacterales bacterium]